jgi:hypothetical protein
MKLVSTDKKEDSSANHACISLEVRLDEGETKSVYVERGVK